MTLAAGEKRRRTRAGVPWRRRGGVGGLGELSPAARRLVLAVCAVAAALFLAAVVSAPPSGVHLGTFAVLLGCALVAEQVRRHGDPAGVFVKDLLSAWWLPILVLLPPGYALLAPFPVMAAAHWWGSQRTPLYRRVYSAAAIGLAHAGASLAFAAVPLERTPGAGPARDLLPWIGAVVACGALATVANALLISTAIKVADPRTTWRELLWDRGKLLADAVGVYAGSLVTLSVALVGAPVALLALPLVLLLERSLMTTQLRDAARVDAKTGLLNAPTWERESAGELLRLRRTGRSAGVLLLDIDHFKRVNDTYGHLVGDAVLKAVADALRASLREQDLVGRFGGEEFVVLLPGADEAQARRTAERLRRRVADVVVPVDPHAPGPTALAQVTVSVGVAVAGPAQLDVINLLAAADLGLYKAKGAGRDRVRLLPTLDRRTGRG